MPGHSGGDRLIVKLTSYLTPETFSTAIDQFTSPNLKRGPSLPKRKADVDVHMMEAFGSTGSSCGVARQRPGRATSESMSRDGLESLLIVSFSNDHQRAYEGRAPAQTSLNPPRPSAHRCASSPVVQSYRHYHNPTSTIATLQQGIIQPPKFPGYQSSASTSPPLISSLQRMQGENGSSPRRHVVIEPTSYRERMDVHVKSRASDQTLKPCIKSKAKSTPTSPPGEQLGSEDGIHSLRRVKTVEFDEKGSKESIESLNPVAMVLGGTTENPKLDRTKTKFGKGPATMSLYPIRLGKMKGRPADPAVTRTDVHVIAIAPSANAATYSNEDSVDPVTPTMQVVESKAGRHEIVWDDVPEEDDSRPMDRRGSSAGQALHNVSCHGKRGLDRVNTKLADWSGSWNSPSNSFQPTTVVFPDEDTQTPHYEWAVEDDEDLTVLAPPNSQRTSVGPSRHQSRPESAPTTRAPSDDEYEASDLVLARPCPVSVDDWKGHQHSSLVVPDPKGRVRHSASTGQMRAQLLPAIHKWSDIEDDDVKFRGHRDSVTTAHSRLVRTGGVSPELFAHGDYVSMAKKRMHARNHAKSASRDTLREEVLQSGLLSLDDVDDDASMVSLEMIKERALPALQKRSAASMLGTHRESPSRRHIRLLG
ncbi:hypothetical protein IAQ61_008649 [Plenodomus lingam]|uniref:uncharacterized protein n=1 Tax=Leptosphaeria maculans TaxID=5022 RepID=UPI0033165BE4|nr:hypothetical protein IAQ61_008649 [Plenodomus lingam]